MKCQDVWCEREHVPSEDLHKLLGLAQEVKRHGEKACNGDYHHGCKTGGFRGELDKSEASRLWASERDDALERFTALAESHGYAVTLPGLYPTLRRDGSDAHLPYYEDKDVNVITIVGRRWFDGHHGNTYFRSDIHVNGDLVHTIPFEYGYGSMYSQAAFEWLTDNGYLSMDRGDAVWQYCQDHDITVVDTVSDVRKQRDLN